MIKISQREAEQLRERGMGNSVKMCNKTHKSRKKRYFAVESAQVLKTATAKPTQTRHWHGDCLQPK